MHNNASGFAFSLASIDAILCHPFDHCLALRRQLTITMRFSPFVSRTAVGAILLPHVTAQWAEGGAFFGGSGIPGAASYQLVDDYDPSVNFFEKFFFYNDYDPTYGHVKYVNETVAIANGYAYVNDAGKAIIKPDTDNLWPPGYGPPRFPDGVFAPGRPSVRVESLNTYTHGLFIFDSTHLPAGCGTWPAYWLLGPNWPSNGEIGKQSKYSL